MRYCVNDHSGTQRDWVNLALIWISGNLWAWFVQKTEWKRDFEAPLGAQCMVRIIYPPHWYVSIFIFANLQLLKVTTLDYIWRSFTKFSKCLFLLKPSMQESNANFFEKWDPWCTYFVRYFEFSNSLIPEWLWIRLIWWFFFCF